MACYVAGMVLSKTDLERLLASPSEAAGITGRFACFQMIPIEDRLGEWRFAGRADNLDEAFERCGALVLRIWPPKDSKVTWTGKKVLLDYLPYYECERRPKVPKERGLPPGAQVVLSVEGAAPYDAVGTAIFSVETWAGLEGRAIEDQVPPPPEGDEEDDEG